MFCKTVPLKYKFILKRVNSKIFVQNSCILIQNVLGYLHLENLKGGKKMSRTHCTVIVKDYVDCTLEANALVVKYCTYSSVRLKE